MIKLIATDIDGTILKQDFVFNQAVKDCINQLTNKGIKVVLVTGRMHAATVHIAKELNLKSPIISYQGGLIKDGENVIYEKTLDVNIAKKIIDWTKENNIHLNLYMDDKLYVEHDNSAIKRYASERKTDYAVVNFDNLKLNKINKMLLVNFDEPQKVTEWKNYLEKIYTNIDFVKSMPFFCEITNVEATKYHALKYLTNYLGLKQNEVMTTGDQNNDINLLKAGGIKVAMGNATDELKAVADFVTDTVENDGFVKAVEKFIGVNDDARL